ATNLMSSQTDTLTINNAQTNDAGDYYVVIANGVGSVTSSVAVVSVQPMDFGDAPASYSTLRTNNGARHVIVPGVFLGTGVSQEADGKPDAGANADDLDDGVSFTTAIVAGQTATVQVVASTNGYLNAWVDFDQSGEWAEAFKQIFN